MLQLTSSRKRMPEVFAQVESEQLAMDEFAKFVNSTAGVALLSLIDPRIPVAWCKQVGLDVRKIFPGVAISDIGWALGTPPGYLFGAFAALDSAVSTV